MHVCTLVACKFCMQPKAMLHFPITIRTFILVVVSFKI